VHLFTHKRLSIVLSGVVNPIIARHWDWRPGVPPGRRVAGSRELPPSCVAIH
jgi:hypothetical protein